MAYQLRADQISAQNKKQIDAHPTVPPNHPESGRQLQLQME